MIEFELKCELSPRLVAKVHEKGQGMTFEGMVHNYDIYYDTPTWELLRRAVFVRVRNQQQLEFKFNVGYVELWLTRHHPAACQAGRYHRA